MTEPKSDDDDVREALTSLGVGPAAKELYVDLVRPAAKELSGSLLTVAKLISVAMAPLQGVVWGMEKTRDWLAAALLKRLASAHPDQIQTPPSYIAGQVLLQLPFCAEQDDLREMYANLLATAMQKDRAPQAHPAFVPVIQQLSPDEALILQTISSDPYPLEMRESLDANGGVVRSDYITRQFRRLCERAGVSNADFSDAYLDNLLRLKIFDEFRWSQSALRDANHFNDEKVVENWSSGLVQLSAFGERFFAACLSLERADDEKNRS